MYVKKYGHTIQSCKYRNNIQTHNIYTNPNNSNDQLQQIISMLNLYLLILQLKLLPPIMIKIIYNQIIQEVDWFKQSLWINGGYTNNGKY